MASYETIVTFWASFKKFSRCGDLWEKMVRVGAKLSNIEQIYWRKARNSKNCHCTPIHNKNECDQQTTFYKNFKNGGRKIVKICSFAPTLPPPITYFRLLGRPMVSVLLSASVKRFCVIHLQNFLILCYIKLCSSILALMHVTEVFMYVLCPLNVVIWSFYCSQFSPCYSGIWQWHILGS